MANNNVAELLKHYKGKVSLHQESARIVEAQYENLLKKLSELLNDASKNDTPIMGHLATILREKDHTKKMDGLEKLQEVVRIHGNQNNQHEAQGGGYPY